MGLLLFCDGLCPGRRFSSLPLCNLEDLLVGDGERPAVSSSEVGCFFNFDFLGDLEKRFIGKMSKGTGIQVLCIRLIFCFPS